MTIPTAPDLARTEYRAWADHMVSQGIAEAAAWRNFAAWAEEDRYFSLEEELTGLAAAGFTAPSCLWQHRPAAVLGAAKG